MKFIELKKELKNKIDNVYLISGEDRFLQDKSINLIRKFAVSDFLTMNESIYNDENINIQHMIEEAQTLPFMSEYRLILMRDCFSKLSESDKKAIKEYIAKPVKTTVFVMCADEKNDFLKKLTNVSQIDCAFLDDKSLKLIVPAMCKENGKQITGIALLKLISYCGNNLGRIQNEVLKLASYCESDTIKPEDVDNLVAKTMDYETYLLANAICDKDSETAIKLFEYILNSSGSSQYVVGALGNFLRRFFYLQATKSDAQLCRDNFHLNEYAYKIMVQKSSNLKKAPLMNSLHEILDVDYKIKSGIQTDENALYDLIIRLTTKL